MRKKKNVDEITLLAAFPIEEHALIAKDERDGAFIVQGDVKNINLPHFARAMLELAIEMMESAGNGMEEYKPLYAKAVFSIIMAKLDENGVDCIRVMKEMLEETE